MKGRSVLGLAALPATAAAASCDCYLSNSTTLKSTQLYTNYVFIDFRSLPAADGASLTAEPDLVSDSQNDGSGNITSSYLSSPDFTKVWAIQNYTKTPGNGSDATVALINSPQNVYVSQDADASTTQLTLRTARLQDFSSCSELNSVSTMQRASFRTRARVRGAGGAVAGIFYYKNDTSESDIEMLTNDPTSTFRASNQPDVGADGNSVPGASTNDTPAGYSYNHWVNYRLDWTAAQSAWYIDGSLVETKTYGVPTGMAFAMLNMWSSGGSWSGNMTVGDRAYMDVQWVELLYNTTTDDSSASCTSTCDVDHETQVGSPSQAAQASQTGQPSHSSVLSAPTASLMFLALTWGIALLFV